MRRKVSYYNARAVTYTKIVNLIVFVFLTKNVIIFKFFFLYMYECNYFLLLFTICSGYERNLHIIKNQAKD